MKAIYYMVTFLAALMVLGWTGLYVYQNRSSIMSAVEIHHKPGTDPFNATKPCSCSHDCVCGEKCDCAKTNKKCKPTCKCK